MLLFLSKLLQSLAVSYLRDGIKKTFSTRYFFSKKAQYKKSLLQTLAQMPFIYKDVDLEVLQDYVDIEVQFVDTKSLLPLHIIKTTRPLDKLNQNFKALFIGSAGMGKSTFFRFSTLSIIKRRDNYFLSSLKGKTPIFISLKTVPNFGKSPILRYILAEISFLQNNGIAKLKNLTAKGKVCFFLDGYDEISFTNSKNHIQYELGILMSTTHEKEFDQDMIDPAYKDIYSNIAQCTVWLSTREEFYRLNPIGLKLHFNNDRDLPSNNKDFIAVQLRGLGDNRLVLVKKIFDKYRVKSKRLAEVLDEEIFIEEVDTHEDKEMVRLSKRPLFLTILCYLHVNYLIDHEGEERPWLPYLHELILECVKVLLSDLDKYKVRHYSVEQKRIAFVNRRSSYMEEKTAFLKYFSFHLMLEGDNIFDYSTLERYLRIYFSNSANSVKGNRIIAEFDTSKSNNPNLATQLIFSGIFVVVNSNQEHLVFDFPHRRFKEVLATEALKEGNMFQYFLEKLTNRNLSEFVLIVFKELTEYRDIIAKKLFNSWQDKDEELYCCQLILNIVHQNPEFKIDHYLLTNIKTVTMQNIYAKIYLEMLHSIRDSYPAIKALLLTDIPDAIHKKKFQAISTLFELAELVAPTHLKEFLDKTELIDVLEIKVIFLKFQIKQYLRNLVLLDNLYTNYSDELSFTAVSTILDQRFNDSFYVDYFTKLPIKKFLIFWHLLYINNERFSVKRKSSIFDNFELIYKEFQDSITFEGLMSTLSNTLQKDLVKHEIILTKSRGDTDKDELINLKKEILSLQTLIQKSNLFTNEDWTTAKNDIKRLDETDFGYLKDRIDKHVFYYARQED